jgi:hypothetical protein
MASGGILGIGSKLLAIPWEALTLDPAQRRMTLNIDKERIDAAPGFDREHWPDMASQAWISEVHTYYGTSPATSGSSHLDQSKR